MVIPGAMGNGEPRHALQQSFSGARADGSYPTGIDPSLRNRRELNGWGDVGLLVHA